MPSLGNQAFFEWCFVVTPGGCSKTDPTPPPLGFFGAVFFGFLGSRPDRFCPFAIVTSNHDCPWMKMRCSQIDLLDLWAHGLPTSLRYAAVRSVAISRCAWSGIWAQCSIGVSCCHFYAFRQRGAEGGATIRSAADEDHQHQGNRA